MSDPVKARLEGRGGQVFYTNWKEKLGFGGFGVVYGGRSESGQDEVAIKVFNHQNTDLMARIEASIQMHRKIRHPRLLPVLDFGTTERDEPFLVMPRARSSIGARMEAGTIPEYEAIPMFYDVVLALHHLHGQNLVHRDIKPSNCLIMEDVRVAVADFDTIKDLDVLDGPTVYSAGIGTFEYRAPEQWDNARQVDDRADVWSLGLTLYRMLTGAKAFQGKVEDGSFINAVRTATIPGDLEDDPRLRVWHQIVLHCTRKNEAVRPSVADLLGPGYLTPLRKAVEICYLHGRVHLAEDLGAFLQRAEFLEAEERSQELESREPKRPHGSDGSLIGQFVWHDQRHAEVVEETASTYKIRYTAHDGGVRWVSARAVQPGATPPESSPSPRPDVPRTRTTRPASSPPPSTIQPPTNGLRPPQHGLVKDGWVMCGEYPAVVTDIRGDQIAISMYGPRGRQTRWVPSKALQALREKPTKLLESIRLKAQTRTIKSSRPQVRPSTAPPAVKGGAPGQRVVYGPHIGEVVERRGSRSKIKYTVRGQTEFRWVSNKKLRFT